MPCGGSEPALADQALLQPSPSTRLTNSGQRFRSACGTVTTPDLAQIIALDAADGIGLKVTKSGGLTRARRQRDMCIAAGYTISVQDTTGSDIAFAAIVHLAQTVPEKWLRCALDCRGITDRKTAEGNYAVTEGAVTAPVEPGLGITPLADVLGKPVAHYGSGQHAS